MTHLTITHIWRGEIAIVAVAFADRLLEEVEAEEVSVVVEEEEEDRQMN